MNFEPKTILFIKNNRHAIILDDTRATSMLVQDARSARYKYKFVFIDETPEVEELASAGFDVFVYGDLVARRITKGVMAEEKAAVLAS